MKQKPTEVNMQSNMEMADLMRERYYARFDRVVQKLPEDLKAVATVPTFIPDDAGVWKLRDPSSGAIVAEVQEEGFRPKAAATARPAEAMTASRVEAIARRCASAQAVPTIKAVNEGLKAQHGAIAEVCEMLADIGGRLRALEDRAEAAEERVADIEQRGFRFVGRYQAANTYRVGDVVSHKDGLWHCTQPTKVGDRPSSSGNKWALMFSGGGE